MFEEHFEILKEGKDIWNEWIKNNWKSQLTIKVHSEKALRRTRIPHLPSMNADLSHGDLTKLKSFISFDFTKVDFSYSSLRGLTFTNCNFRKANFSNADLRNTNFTNCIFSGTNLIHANLGAASFKGSQIENSNFSDSNCFNVTISNCTLTDSALLWAKLIETEIVNSRLVNCRIYGASIWNIDIRNTIQSNIIITQSSEPTISIDNIEVAQFLHLLIVNKKIRNIIDSLTSKVVLILGRFTPERKAVLDSIKLQLSQHNYVPVIFDFQKPNSKDFIEPVLLLAQLAKFVIADFSDAKIILEEITAIARNTSTVIVPILQKGEFEPVTLKNLKVNHKSITKTYYYNDINHLIDTQFEKIIKNASLLFSTMNKRKVM